MKTIWVLAADSSRARLLQIESRAKLAEVARFEQPEGHVGRYLEKARAERRYDELVVIAPPQLLGALRKELGSELGKLVAGEATKDLSMLSPRARDGWLSTYGRAL